MDYSKQSYLIKNQFTNAQPADIMYYQQLRKKMNSPYLYQATLIVEKVGERLNQSQTHELKSLIIEALEQGEQKGYERAITDPKVMARLKEVILLTDD